MHLVLGIPLGALNPALYMWRMLDEITEMSWRL